MTHLSPQSLTADELQALLRASAGSLRDHLIFSLALGTGLRLSELVGLNVGDLYFPNGQPRIRVRVRPEIVGIPDHSEHGFRGNLNADSGAK